MPVDAVSADQIAAVVAGALAEDIGSGDLTAALIDADRGAGAEVVLKAPAVLCGTAWFDEVFRQLDGRVAVHWRHADGDSLDAGTVVCTMTGPARAMLSGERTALNFLQTLSGTATAAAGYVRAAAGTGARILDTRKTLPGLRAAQKYAVARGGAHNHRKGLYDAILIKENHVAAAGGIGAAVERARRQPGAALVEVEVENLEQLREALATDVDRIMLDNFALADLRAAVAMRDAATGRRKELEASGGITLRRIAEIAATGVDWISVGAMTKDLAAADLSMRFVEGL